MKLAFRYLSLQFDGHVWRVSTLPELNSRS